MKRAALLALLLLVPIVMGAHTLDVTARSVTTSGSTQVGGALAAIVSQDTSGLLPVPSFQLSAARIDVETDEASLAVSRSGSVPAWRNDPSTQKAGYDLATVSGSAVRNGFRLLLIPTDADVRLESACASLTAMDAGGMRWPAFIQRSDRRPDMKPATHATVSVQPCRDSVALTVSGDFQVVLWQWDSTLTDATAATDLPSGYSNDIQSSAWYGPAREQFLTVKNGTFQGELSTNDTTVLLGWAELAGPTSLRLAEAVIDGTLSESATVTGSDRVAVTPLASALSLQMVGKDLMLNGEAVFVSSGNESSWIMPVALGVSLALGLAVAWRWTAQTRQWRKTYGSASGSIPYAMARFATRLGIRRAALMAHNWAAASLALRDVRRGHNASEAARTAVEIGRTTEAVAWLIRALENDLA